MQFTPNFTHLVTRLRDGARIIVPNRRYDRGATPAQHKAIRRVTDEANQRAADARKAAERKNS
jgi:hypothetical protein